MPPFKPDTDSFHRLLASLGVLLVALSIGAPIFVFKETAALKVPETELARLTPVARSVLVSRQERLQDIEDVLPALVLSCFVAGVALLIFGARGMKALQAVEYRTAVANAAALEAQVESQSPAEQAERLREEATTAIAMEAVEAADPSIGRSDQHPDTDTATQASGATEDQAPPSQAETTVPDGIGSSRLPGRTSGRTADYLRRQAEDLYHEYEAAETAVLGVLSHIRTPGYTFRAHVAFRDGSGSRVRLDGLFSSHDPGMPDVIVEIKRSARARNIRLGSDQLLAHLTRYETATGRRATGWLIVVTDDQRDTEPLRSGEASSLLGDRGKVDVVTLDTIESLTWSAIRT